MHVFSRSRFHPVVPMIALLALALSACVAPAPSSQNIASTPAPDQPEQADVEKSAGKETSWHS